MGAHTTKRLAERIFLMSVAQTTQSCVQRLGDAQIRTQRRQLDDLVGASEHGVSAW
jgi:hypothetical protein